MDAPRSAALLLALTLLGGAACGGDEGPSRAEFVKEANAACERGSDELAREEKRAFGGLEPGKKPKRSVLEEYVRTAVRIVEKQTDEIAALTPPDELADDVDSMIRELRTAIDELKKEGLAVLRKEPDPFSEANAIAADLGLDECAD